MNNKTTISDNDFPGLFISADYTSKKAQNFFLIMNATLLIVLIITAFVSENFNQTILKNVTFFLLLVALILNIIIYYSQFEKTWYEGRAVAESIKTLSWKYMMISRPFETSNESEADKIFLDYLNSLIGKKKSFFDLVGGKFSSVNQITVKMRNVRNLNYDKRLNIYSTERLKNQLHWYKKKSNTNRTKKTYLFLLNACLIIFILAAIAFDFEWIERIKMVSFLITFITSILAWMQIKNYQELSYSYALTAHELSIIRSKTKLVDSESKLSDFVDDSETAISREHTMWLARRDHLHLFDK
ncbi:DUF4231 domain-containing protein [Bizionia myxarmorum]|uniref:DUF4231 domain-containing protein n=1 Tax=Bizionia myxarmorum TaxID=291186 RepID=A0A5D0R609_9FLAO|nr:DUF4231 domain-containing protein [Bizionia myxarmorum]TYB76291.1 DUF4231 domain-containing protein [Bizionia myxarmorum]